MAREVASAVFDTRVEAERAVQDLRGVGVPDSSISVVSRDHDEDLQDHDNGGHGHADSKASGTAKGIGIGAGAGAIAGLAALAIPGAGPFLAAGAIGEALGIVGSAAATSAVVGGAIGGLTGALMDYGVSEEDARYYDEHISKGGVWVGVDLTSSRAGHGDVERILTSAGGHRSRTAAT